MSITDKPINYPLTAPMFTNVGTVDEYVILISVLNNNSSPRTYICHI